MNECNEVVRRGEKRTVLEGSECAIHVCKTNITIG